MKTAASYLLLGLLGVIGFLFSLVSLRRLNQFGHPASGIIWFTIAVVCFCAMILFADYLEEVNALERISRRVEAMILAFLNQNADHGS